MKKIINFNDKKSGNYTMNQLNNDWGNPREVKGIKEGRCKIISERYNKILRVSFPKGTYGLDNSGARWKIKFDKEYNEVYIQYKVKFAKKFGFRRGGKLPGLGGGSNPTGGKDSSKGFSARIMWRENGQIEQYVYHPGREGRWGKDFFWHNLTSKKLELLKFKPGKWHTVKTKISLKNEFPWKQGGYIISWLDGKLALFQDVKLKDKKEKYGIDNFNFSVFFGGGDKTWATVKDEYVYFKDFVISDKDIKEKKIK